MTEHLDSEISWERILESKVFKCNMYDFGETEISIIF